MDVFVENYRISNFQVHAFGTIFTGVKISLIPNNIPNGLTVQSQGAEYGEPSSLSFYTNKFSKNPDESFPNLLAVHVIGGSAPMVLELECKQVY